MRTTILITGIVLAILAPACGSRHEGASETSPSGTNSSLRDAPLPPRFAFFHTNVDAITLEEVTNRIGPYSRVGHLSPNDPELTYEFDFEDHTALLVTLKRPFQSRNTVQRV